MVICLHGSGCYKPAVGNLAAGFVAGMTERRKKMAWIACAAAWISTAAAVVAGVHVTGSAWCLWAMVLPLMITVKESKKDEGEEE